MAISRARILTGGNSARRREWLRTPPPASAYRNDRQRQRTLMVIALTWGRLLDGATAH
ncbi:MAG: hypothetical protein LBD30_06720 [Verrucomicrobiales bacterium]|nr:hypothetical protein [Verrucomicrobiales bacterium]